MEDKKYQVLFYGELLPGADAETVKNKLAVIFRVEKSRIEDLFSGGGKVVKKNASRQVCEKTKALFKSVGAVVAVVPQVTREEPPPPPPDLDPKADPEFDYPQFTDGPWPPGAEKSDAAEEAPADSSPAGAVSKPTLLLLTGFLGCFGIHKFYLARYIQGALSILFCWTGIPALIATIEFFIYAFSSQATLQRRYQTGSTPLVIMMAVFGPFFFMTLVALFLLIGIPLILVHSRGDIAAAVTRMTGLPPIISGKPAAVPLPRPRPVPVPRPVAEPAPAPVAAAASPEPSGGCFGKIKGLDFVVEQASVRDGVLRLSQGQGLSTDREMIIFLLLNEQNPSHRRIVVSADKNSYDNPHIHLRWKTGDDTTPKSDVVMDGYDMYLEFGEVTGSTLSGKIDLKIPGDPETRLAGAFTADVSDK